MNFQEKLLQWFRKNARPLPWRKHYRPYEVWISEIMLQQTQMETVLPYFNRWMKAFPTIESLARADEKKVLKLWEGLGYYSRARNNPRRARAGSRRYPPDHHRYREGELHSLGAPRDQDRPLLQAIGGGFVHHC